MHRRALLKHASFITLGLGTAALLPSRGLRAQVPMSVRLIAESPLEEPFFTQLHLALTRLQGETGFDYQYAELVKPGDYARVLRQWCDEGVRLIVGDAYGTEQICRRTARDYPETAFVLASAVGPTDPNVSTYYGQNYEACYLAGMLAAGMSKTGVLGAVAGLDVPATNANIHAYRAGAQFIRPDAKVKVAFIGSWFDPAKAKEATLAQAQQGADVIYADRIGAIEGAAEAGVLALGFMADQAAVAPQTVITSIMWDPYPVISDACKNVMAGTFTATDLSPLEMLAAGGSYLAPYGAFADKVPAELQARIKAKSDEISAGAFVVDYVESTPVSD